MLREMEVCPKCNTVGMFHLYSPDGSDPFSVCPTPEASAADRERGDYMECGKCPRRIYANGGDLDVAMEAEGWGMGRRKNAKWEGAVYLCPACTRSSDTRVRPLSGDVS